MNVRGFACALVAAVVAALLCAAPSGAAERVAVSGGSIYQGPFLAGGGVAWRDLVCADLCDPLYPLGEVPTTVRLRIARPGRRPVVLDQVEEAPYDGGGEDPPAPRISREFLLSGDTMVRSDELDVEAYDTDDAFGVRRLRVGRIGARLPTLYRCRYSSVPPVEGTGIALDRGRLAYRAGACRDGGSLVVRNLRTGRVRTIAQPAGGSLRVAALRGRFLIADRTLDKAGDTYGEYAGGRLLDWRSGRVVADFPPDRRALDAIALGADGTVATVQTDARDVRDDRCLGIVSLYRPPGYRERVMGHRACPALRLVRDGLLFRTDRLPGRAGRSARPSGIRRVTWAGRARTVAHFAAAEATDDFDADDRHIVFGVQRCDDQQDLVRLATGEREYGSGTLACPVRFPERAVHVKGKRARVRVWCPYRCKGVLFVQRGKRRLAAGRFRAGGVETVFIPLTKLGAATLRRRASVRGRFRAVVLDRNARRRTFRGAALFER